MERMIVHNTIDVVLKAAAITIAIPLLRGAEDGIILTTPTLTRVG
jgi:hypothetical protein